MTATESGVRTPDLRTWLTERIAFYLELPAADIDPARRLVEIGLDSIYALTLCGDIEDEFGLVVESTLAWDHPTVDALTDHLAQQLGTSG